MFIQNWNAKMSQSMQIIESKDDLIKPFEDGEKNHKDFKIGTANIGVPIKMIFLAISNYYSVWIFFNL